MISYGMTGSYASNGFDVLSPLYYMSREINAEMDYSGEYVVCKGLTGSSVVIGYAVVAVVLIVLSYLIYRIRNMETAGNLISISWIGPLFRWGAAFCGGALFGVFFCSIFNVGSTRQIFVLMLIITIIFGGFCFFGAQMFLEKGFRVFSKKRIMECGVFVGVFAILLIGIECNLFGQESKLPALDEIKSAYINRSYPVGGEDSEQIEEVLALHKQIIDSKKEFESFAAGNNQSSWVYVKYHLKDGSVFERSYTIPATDEMLEDSSTVYGKIAEMTASPKAYLKNTFCVNYEDIEPSRCYMDIYNKEANNEYRAHEFSKEDTQKLYDAVLADLEAGNFKNVIMNSMRGDDDYAKYTYYNSLSMDYLCKNGIINIYDLYNEDFQGEHYGYSYETNRIGNACIEFDSECKNIISALIETGAIESEDDLITIEERNELDEDYEK